MKEKVTETWGEDIQLGVREEQEQEWVEGNDIGGELFEYQSDVRLFDRGLGQHKSVKKCFRIENNFMPEEDEV